MITPAHKPSLSLQNRVVRELTWACFSTPLIDCDQLRWHDTPAANCQLTLTPERMAWLRALDADPAPLEAQLATVPGPRLGLYFEKLWHFFLAQDRHTDLIATNLAVRDQGRTLGEFDVLYFCHQRQRAVHLELAVKFYLCAPGVDGSAWPHWLGPNARDRLDLKLERMMQHQVTLSERPQARAQLKALGITVPPLREMEVKGRLYARHPAHCLRPPGLHSARALDAFRYQREDEQRSRPTLEATDAELAGAPAQPGEHCFIVHRDWPHQDEASSQG